MGSRWLIRRFRTGPQSEPPWARFLHPCSGSRRCAGVRRRPQRAASCPGVAQRSGGFARGRASTPIRTGAARAIAPPPGSSGATTDTDHPYGRRVRQTSLPRHSSGRSVAAPVAARCETDQWLQRFDDHLMQVHGLVVGTRRMYRRYAAALLAECAGTPTPDWSRLTVPAIAAFVQTQANRLGPSTRRSPVTATRAFLRFLTTRGVIPAGIDGAVPTIRQWTHAALPRAVAAEDVERVLAAVDVTRPERAS